MNMKRFTILFVFLIGVGTPQSLAARENDARRQNVVLDWNSARFRPFETRGSHR